MINSYFKAAFIFLLLSGCATQEYKPTPLSLYMQESRLPAINSLPPDSLSDEENTSISLSETLAKPKRLTLNQIIQTALKADPRIGAAFENITQAEADLLTAGLVPNPQANTDVQLLPLDRPFTVNRQGGPPQFDFDVAMPIDWFLFGKRAAAITSRRYGVDIAAADFSNIVRLRIAAAISAFYDVLEAQAMLALAHENQNNLNRMEQIILKRVALGGVGTIEADRIRLSLFSSRREVRTQELNLAGALNRLRSLIGIAGNIPINIQGTLEVIKPAKPIATETAFDLAEENRPDLISLHRQLDKANADIKLEQRKAYPEVTPSVLYARQFQQQAIGFPDANSWGVGVNVSVPIFDRNQGNIAKAKSLHVQSQLNIQAQLVDLRAEIDQAVKAFASSYQFLTTDDPGQLDAAKNVRDKISQAYELGGKSLLEVLDAQRTYLETYRVHISGRSSYWHSLHQLNAVIGKEVVR
ncbi:TolC family protein [Candidatus Methylobacter favarea]|uniref:TolC family protein n=1 Tax=Candidatus Methylobacter favarea TaxID=2707345 RepID=A0A8S0YA31_9GAMM|nr:TolC family protein [Candidatus Methylobacter favarea]CAA9891011.1 TolC family protein [Candidatus Methylobacter favarea]